MQIVRCGYDDARHALRLRSVFNCGGGGYSQPLSRYACLCQTSDDTSSQQRAGISGVASHQSFAGRPSAACGVAYCCCVFVAQLIGHTAPNAVGAEAAFHGNARP